MHSLCRIAALAALVVLPLTAASEVYKWVDDDGVTHYEQQPPPDGDAALFDPDVSAPAEAPASDSEAAASDDGDEDGAAGDGSADTMEAYCEQMREEAETLAGDAPVRVRQEDGDLQRLEGEARQQRLEEARTLIAENCDDTESDSP